MRDVLLHEVTWVRSTQCVALRRPKQVRSLSQMATTPSASAVGRTSDAVMWCAPHCTFSACWSVHVTLRLPPPARNGSTIENRKKTNKTRTPTKKIKQQQQTTAHERKRCQNGVEGNHPPALLFSLTVRLIWARCTRFLTLATLSRWLPAPVFLYRIRASSIIWIKARYKTWHIRRLSQRESVT